MNFPTPATVIFTGTILFMLLVLLLIAGPV